MLRLRLCVVLLCGVLGSASNAEAAESRRVGDLVGVSTQPSSLRPQHQRSTGPLVNVEKTRILQDEEEFEAIVFLHIKSQEEELKDEKNFGKSVAKQLGNIMKAHEIDKVNVAVQEWTEPAKGPMGKVVSTFGTIQLTLEVQGWGPAGKQHDEDIVKAITDHVEDFESDWAEYGLAELDDAFGLPSEAPSAEPTAAPTPGPTSWETEQPTAIETTDATAAPSPLASSEGTTTLFHTPYETNLRLRLYGIEKTIPDDLIDAVEGVIRDFINSHPGPTPQVAFSVSAVELLAQSSNVGRRRLQQIGELTMELKVNAEGISSSEEALERVDVDETVQHGFVTDYIAFLQRLKAVDGIFTTLILPPEVGDQINSPQDEPKGKNNNLLIIIATALVSALVVAILVFMYVSRRKYMRGSVDSITTTKEDELTTKPTMSDQDQMEVHPSSNSDSSKSNKALEVVKEEGMEANPNGSVMHSESDLWSYVSSNLESPSINNFDYDQDGTPYDEIGLALSEEALEVFDRSITIKKHEFEFGQALMVKAQADSNQDDQEKSIANQTV